MVHLANFRPINISEQHPSPSVPCPIFVPAGHARISKHTGTEGGSSTSACKGDPRGTGGQAGA
eukprot:1158656-Pelagomonas_calceolata.AAC.3